VRREGWSSTRAKGSAFSHWGSTYYGATYYGATYYGATCYGATCYGATCTRGITFSLRVGAVRLE